MKNGARARFVRGEAGFTLTEVLVTMMIMIIVLFALYSLFDMTLRIYSVGNDKVEATEQARLGTEKMTREIQGAYPVDKITGKTHVFFTAGSSATPTLPSVRSMTFGDDIPDGTTTPPNRMIDATEEITYELRSSSNTSNPCPASTPSTQDKGICTLVRRKGSVTATPPASFQPVVENVVPEGLTFTYFTNSVDPTTGAPVAATAADGTDIGVVRVKLKVSVDRGIQEQPVMQTLTTDVDLKNK